MTKKLIALVEVLMVISLLCTGYASWVISTPYQPTWQFEGTSFEAYNVTKRKLADYGITLATSASTEGSTLQAQTFRYSTITSSTGTTYKMTNTTLSILMVITDTTMNAMLAEAGADYRQAAVVVTCKDSAEGKLTGGSLESYGFKAPDYAKLSVDGYPNLSVSAAVDKESNGSLSVRFPLEQIYNLAKLDKINTNYTVLLLELPFVDGITLNQAYSAIGAVEPSFSAYVAAA